MKNFTPAKSPPQRLLLAGLMVAGVFAGFEVEAIFLTDQSWTRLLSAAGLLSVVAYLSVAISGLTLTLSRLLAAPRLEKASAWIESLGAVRWLGVAFLTLSLVWFYLYSPWQDVLRGPWIQFTFAFGLAHWIALLAAPRRPPDVGGEEIALVLGLFLYPRVVLELRVLFAQALVYRGATVLGYLLVCGLAVWLFAPAGQRLRLGLVARRNRLGWLRWALAVVFLCGPVLFYFASWKTYVANPAIRFSLLLIEVFAVAALIWKDDERLNSFKTVILSAFALTLVSALVGLLLMVVDYPFSLGWSEGNRFYDYSLIFGQRLYDYPGVILNPYNSPGRYVLWGILFLVRGLPIEVHRFWNVVLLVVPPLLVGWLLARRISQPFLRVGLALWIALLFVVDSPLHPPFILTAIIVFAFMFDPSPLRRGLSLAVAGFYAGLSRWTWVPAAVACGVLVDLILYYPSRKGTLLNRLAPTFLLALIGLLPGLVSGYSNLAVSANVSTFNQPLLWYRLLPNPTFPLGVLLSVVLVSGPLLAILIWWILSRRWQLDLIQLLAILGAVIGFLGAGLIVSTKIGGGADLHNLDMYLMTLTLILGLGFYTLSESEQVDLHRWPVWLQLLLALAALLPVYGFTPFSSMAAYSPRLDLAKPQDVNQALDEIRQQVARSAQQGEVLFMDQRQLVTFGYIRGVLFAPEYEKKYMMDQALAGNSAYFQAYYQDLARGRFSLILTEVLRSKQETGGDFSEENNQWVKWVSEPTLCFYQPLAIYKDVNVELLIPKQNPTGCESYLSH